MKKNISKSTHKKAKTVYTVRQQSVDHTSRITKNSSQAIINSKRNTTQSNKKNNASSIIVRNLLSSKATTELKTHTNLLSLNNKQNINTKSLLEQNKNLIQENKQLKDKVCKIQQDALHDKQKIKNLITRISDLKRPQSQVKKLHTNNSTEKLKLFEFKHENKQNIKNQSYCNNKFCQQRRKYLESQLYKQRVKRNDLQLQKRKWQLNKNELRNQYRQLLNQIQQLKYQKQDI